MSMRIKKTRGLIDKSLLLKMIVTRARGCGQGWEGGQVCDIEQR
jgi:hypothetical protein